MTRVAITLGDPRGVGPELVECVLRDPPPEAQFVVIGPEDLVAGLPAEQIGVNTGPGSDEVRAGRLAGAAIERAAALALDGSVDAIVTGPVHKHALHAAGYRYPGHTEWLADLAGGVDVVMMLAVDRLRVCLVTTHIPLREVPDRLSEERVVRTGEIVRNDLRRRFGLAEPRLAVCALNPHAGESGLFGLEDRDILAPAARTLGATGPVPADTVFVRALQGEFDAVLAPYHDVGMTAIKVAGFGRAVNVTLGLPFIRTSPDHGTAFDLAGTGRADPGSMREAVRLAIRLARRA